MIQFIIHHYWLTAIVYFILYWITFVGVAYFDDDGEPNFGTWLLSVFWPAIWGTAVAVGLFWVIVIAPIALAELIRERRNSAKRANNASA